MAEVEPTLEKQQQLAEAHVQAKVQAEPETQNSNSEHKSRWRGGKRPQWTYGSRNPKSNRAWRQKHGRTQQVEATKHSRLSIKEKIHMVYLQLVI